MPYQTSKEKRYFACPQTCALFEHEYELDLSDDKWKKIAENVEQCLRNFYGSEIFAMFQKLPRENWLEIEDPSFFYLDGIKIWAVIDCSFRSEDEITIIDWETGRSTTA
jgi:hypothetical protein